MKKIKKISLAVLIGVVSFTALYYSALISIPHTINLNNYKEDVFKAIEKETGFKTATENIQFKKSLTPYLKVNFYHTVVLYPNDKVFLKIKEANLKVKIIPLLFKKIVIEDIEFTRPIINVYLYQDFSTSLDKYINPDKIVNTKGFKFDGLITDSLFNNYKLKIHDETIDKIFSLEGEKLVLKDFKLNKNVHFIVKGTLSDEKNKYLNYDLDITSPLKLTVSKLNFSPFKTIYDSKINGDIYGHLKITDNNSINGELNIKDISLKADNVNLKNNKINMTFKDNKINFDSELHTSDKDTAQISGKILYGKKKYIELNTKAQNINLENLYKILSTLSAAFNPVSNPTIYNIKNYLNELNLKGLLNAEFDVTSDFIKLKSQGKANIVNAQINHKSFPYGIDKINADVNFNNNQIKIENATANINNTPINLNGIINEDVSFSINASSDNLNIVNLINLFNLKENIPFDIKSGLLSFNSNISGSLNKQYIGESKIELKNFNLKNKSLNIPICAKTISLNIKNDNEKFLGNAQLNDVSTTYNKQKIISDLVKLSFDNNKITLDENKVITPINLTFSGIINNYLNKPEGYINFKENVDSQKLAQMLKTTINMPYSAKGDIITSGEITFNKDNINIKAKMNADSENYISYTVIKELLNKSSLLNVDCDLVQNTIKINDISLSEISTENKPKNIIKISGEVINNKIKEFKNLNIIIPNSLSFNSAFFGGEELSFNANVKVNGNEKSPEFSGNAKIFECKFKKYLTILKNADLSFAKNNMRIIAPNIQVNDSSFNIVSDIVTSSDLKNIIVENIQINSLNLDLNNLFMILDNEKNPFKDSVLTIKKGMAVVNKLKILDLKATDVTTNISMEKNIIKLSDIFAKAYGGLAEGKMDYNLATGILDINMKGKGLNIQNSLYDLAKLSDNLEGKTDAEVNLSLATSKDEKEVIKSINGKLYYNASNGKMGTLGKFEYYMYAKNLMYHGLLNATLNRIVNIVVHDNTAQYISSSGNIFFQNGYIITDDLKTIGNNMSLLVKGKHNLLTNQANLNIYGRISDEVKNKLGSFGDVSLAEVINGQQSEKTNTVMKIPTNIMKQIPELYNQKDSKTNTFRVDIYGDISALNSIDSFMWTVSDTETLDIQNQEALPDFSDMLDNL